MLRVGQRISIASELVPFVPLDRRDVGGTHLISFIDVGPLSARSGHPHISLTADRNWLIKVTGEDPTGRGTGDRGTDTSCPPWISLIGTQRAFWFATFAAPTPSPRRALQLWLNREADAYRINGRILAMDYFQAMCEGALAPYDPLNPNLDLVRLARIGQSRRRPGPSPVPGRPTHGHDQRAFVGWLGHPLPTEHHLPIAYPLDRAANLPVNYVKYWSGTKW